MLRLSESPVLIYLPLSANGAFNASQADELVRRVARDYVFP